MEYHDPGTWRLPTAEPHVIDSLAEDLSITPTLAAVLVAKGYGTQGQARTFLNPTCADLHDSLLMVDMGPAVERVHRAIAKQEWIAVLGHDDVDGVSGTVALIESLRYLGGRCIYYIPDRVREGHGISEKALEHFVRARVSLVVTVDTGIGDSGSAARARDLGIDVVITDHHEILTPLPVAVAVIDPKREDSSYPCPSLAGAGVAFKLAQALLGSHSSGGQERTPRGSSASELLSRLLEVVCLGTIADRVPLIDENRAIARLGLDQLLSSDRPAVSILRENIDVERGAPRVRPLVSRLLPLIASARSERGKHMGCDFLLADDPGDAQEMLLRLVQDNEKRRDLARRSYERAAALASERAAGDHHAVVLLDDRIPIRLLGYCASRLAQAYRRPAFVMRICEREQVMGEARAPMPYDILGALREQKDHLANFGGHKRAAGFKTTMAALPEFTSELNSYFGRRFPREELGTVVFIDAVVAPGDLTERVAQDLRSLEPFGEGNPRPLLLLRGLAASDLDESDARTTLRATGIEIQAELPWSLGETEGPVDAIVSFRERRDGSPFLQVLGITPAP